MATVTVLGVAQDAGVPHLGCSCRRCEAARVPDGPVRYPSSILLETDAGDRFLFDATPDIRFQIERIPDGVFLTHAHLGHLPGLLFFGREAADATDLPVYATEGLCDVIRENAPLGLLVENDTIDLATVGDGTSIDLGGVTVTSHHVPHRESLPTDTLAYTIDGPRRSLLYVTDIDEWTPATRALVEESDVALVDGTFWSGDELDRVDEVPHPFVRTSIERLDPTTTETYFTHLNHTNPLLETGSQAAQRLAEAGFSIARRGMTVEV